MAARFICPSIRGDVCLYETGMAGKRHVGDKRVAAYYWVPGGPGVPGEPGVPRVPRGLGEPRHSRHPPECYAAGKSSSNVAPPSGVLSALTVPPWRSMIARTIDSPRPLPDGTSVPARDASTL